MELSLLKLLGLESPLEMEPYPLMLPLPRLLKVEFVLLMPCGVCVLHRLFTLSLRFIIALCTKPPMPFVGEGARSGEILPCVGDIARPRTEPL
jgi:hypothetical protein